MGVNILNKLDQPIIPLEKKDIQRIFNTSAFVLNLPLSGYINCQFVDEQEMKKVNYLMLGKDKVTNILSFVSPIPPKLNNEHHVGDLLLCPSYIKKEALENKIPLEYRWTHLLVHGYLHLIGMDHLKDDEAMQMEAWESKILACLGLEYSH